MKILTLPQLHQTYEYDCGAKILQTVLAYYGIEIREEHLLKNAKTSKDGTLVKNMVSVFKKYGLKTDSREMNITDVKNYLNKKIPVVLLLQAWSERKNTDWKNDIKDGHYVVAIGYTKDRVIFEDPYSFHRTYLKYKELEDRWHDIDPNGKKYFHHGIAVFGKIPKFKSEKIIHMD